MARPTKPYKTSWGKTIDGLYHCPDGRWRINSTGEKYREPNEHAAVTRFLAWKAKHEPTSIVVSGEMEGQFWGGKLDENGNPQNTYITKNTTISHELPEAIFWQTVRTILEDRMDYFEQMTGYRLIPGVTTPVKSLKLADILACYKAHADVQTETKREAGKTFDEFVSITGATTLADLTTDRLVIYRNKIKSRVSSPLTIAAYFGRIKWIVKFAKSEGMDTQQIDEALSRLVLLKAPKDTRTHNPTPISREAFHKLLKESQKNYPQWTTRLVLMMNLCLHFDECLDVEWDDFDLKAGTFCTKRNKRGRVIRAATLWPETIKLLKAMKKTMNPHVFVSKFGKRWNARGQWKTWDNLRNDAGCESVQMDDIRDGAYTAACNAKGVDEKFARLLAGHRSHGLQDSYVERNPSVVAPACEAVYKVFGPLPVK